MGQRLNKVSRVTQHDRAILKVKTLRDTIKIYQRKIEQKVTFEQELAVRLLLTGNREKAKCILRKRMALEDHLKATDGHLENLERMINHLEFSSVVQKVTEALKEGNKALKKAYEVLNIKNVETLLEETAVGIQKQAEINELIKGLTAQTEAKEELIEEELNALLRTRAAHDEKMNEKDQNKKTLNEPKYSEPSGSSEVKKEKKPKEVSNEKKKKSHSSRQVGIVIRN